MEDVKEQMFFLFLLQSLFVSILVLMEDVKELYEEYKILKSKRGFNPCFNGRCKRTGNGRGMGIKLG